MKCKNYDKTKELISKFNLITNHLELLKMEIKVSNELRIVESAERELKSYEARFETILYAVRCLSQREQNVIRNRYFFEKDWETISNEMLYSRQAVYRFHENAMQKLSVILFGDESLFEGMKVK